VNASFHFYAHSAITYVEDGRPRTDIVATIAGFRSRSYAESFAAKHSEFGALVIVTGDDLADGVLRAYRDGNAVSLPCPCIDGDARCDTAANGTGPVLTGNIQPEKE
jgi:hypothetical protein